MPIVVNKSKQPVDAFTGKVLPKPSERYQAVLSGPATQPSAGYEEPLRTFKRVHFNKDILLEKLKTFKDIITYFNSLEKNPHGEAAAKQAYDWVVKQFAEDVFDALQLDKFQWEFESLAKIQLRKKQAAAPHPDAELDALLIKGPVGEFVRRGIGFDLPLPEGTYHRGVHIDLDDEETKAEFKKQVASRNKVKRKLAEEGKKAAVNENTKVKPLIEPIAQKKPFPPKWDFQTQFMSDARKCDILEESFAPRVEKDLWSQTKETIDENDPKTMFRIDLGRIKNYLDLCEQQRKEAEAKRQAEEEAKAAEEAAERKLVKRLQKAAKAASRRSPKKKKRK